MKQFHSYKIVQLIILILLTLISLFALLQPEVKQFVFSSTAATILFITIWVVLLASFIFLLIDFSKISSMKLDYNDLYGVAYADQVSGMPNRFSCDTLIEKYYDQDLPSDVGCIMIDLSNLTKVNQQHDRKVGNQMLKDFSDILTASAVSLCFVGRNGGNKFLAIFEDCTEEKLQSFLSRIDRKIEEHNAQPDALAIEYKAGSALNAKEGLTQIDQLISLANKRISETSDKERG